jgi:butyryl-CoA dehydrogenase
MDLGDRRSAAGVFIVEKNMPGFFVGEREDMCGMRANPVSSLFFEDVRVPQSHLLGQPGDGLKIGLITLDTGRIGVGAQALGVAQAAFEAAVKYSKERQQFRKPISSFQTIQNYLADMATHFPTCALAVIDFDLPAWPDLAVRTGKLVHFIVPRRLSQG